MGGMRQLIAQSIASGQTKMKIKIKNKVYQVIEAEANGVWFYDEHYADCFISNNEDYKIV
tara:strand:- start:700 stop:879 length:180 start_codon:yes stop_codon:yes gene_type:complete